ncbi:hypothetical protein LCGC14_0693620 [marine sediment metagenome]|uniref:Transcription factor zinc-finger domain-containing protein n=1 Tax=marine sediment metagenome TaxID=412755 RepID=A0A0F9T5Z9_9ZZZZ
MTVLKDRPEKCPLCGEMRIQIRLHAGGGASIRCRACKSAWELPDEGDVDRVLRVSEKDVSDQPTEDKDATAK